MPGHDVHHYTERKILKKTYPDVDKYKDRAVWKLGYSHRVVGHPIINLVKALKKKDVFGIVRSLTDPDLKKMLQESDSGRKVADLLHELVDMKCSADKRLKVILQVLALLDKR